VQDGGHVVGGEELDAGHADRERTDAGPEAVSRGPADHNGGSIWPADETARRGHASARRRRGLRWRCSTPAKLKLVQSARGATAEDRLAAEAEYRAAVQRWQELTSGVPSAAGDDEAAAEADEAAGDDEAASDDEAAAAADSMAGGNTAASDDEAPDAAEPAGRTETAQVGNEPDDGGATAAEPDDSGAGPVQRADNGDEPADDGPCDGGTTATG
jgi:hypothetical protein